MKKRRIAALLLALALCLGLLPMTAMAEETEGEHKSFTITFDANGGKFPDGKAVWTTTTTWQGAGNHISEAPADPQWVNDDYLFDGWDIGSETSIGNVDFTADVTVKAKWRANSNIPVLKLDPNGGTCSVESVKLERLGDAFTLKEELPTPTRPGYTFEGWFAGGTEVKAGSAFSGTETAVAKWTQDNAQNGVRVDFIPNGGVITSIRGIPAKDIQAGSELAGKHNIFVDRNSGIGMMTTDAAGRLDSFPEIEREGYTFDGWYDVGKSVLTNAYNGKEVEIPSGAKRADLTTVFKADALLAAKWTEKSASKDGPFTVKFDLNYKNPKEDEIPKEKTVVKGDTVGLPDGSKLTSPASNYEFYAWCIEGTDGKLYRWKESNPVTEDMTLYAGWVKKGTVVKDGQAIESKPAETQKPAESEKPAESQKPAGTPASKFADVAATSPFAPAISWAVEKKITNGKTDTTFGPGDSCTRAQIVTFLWRATGSPEPKLTETQYMDVTDPGAYYYKAVQWAAELDMEYSGTFDPHKTCDRASAAYFIWKAFGSPKAAAKSSFTDMPEEPKTGGQWYWPDLLDAVDWAVGQGVTNGTGDGTTFSPDNPCTRGQIVTFLYRAYEK